MAFNQQKIFSFKYDPVNYPTDTVNKIVREYTDTLVTDSLNVLINGQAIPKYVPENNGNIPADTLIASTNSFAKYFYTLSVVGSTITITVYANPKFSYSEFTGGVAEYNVQFSSTDLLYIDYTITVP